MTPEQIAAYRRLLDDSISPRAEQDPEKYIFLRGWNAAIQHAGEMLDKTLKSALAPATVADTAAAPGLTDPPVAAAVSGATPSQGGAL